MAVGAALALSVAFAQTPVEGEPYVDHIGESPMLAEMAEFGDLPPVAERLPVDFQIIRPRDEIGVYGGEFHAVGNDQSGAFTGDLIEGSGMSLAIWDPSVRTIVPNVVKGWELSEDATTFTLFLREGMRWSDGELFDADDFEFWYLYEIQNDALGPASPSRFFPGGELMGFEKIDQYTVRYTFSVPVFSAIEQFMTAKLWTPEHFLKQYHIDFNPDAQALAESEGFDSWERAYSFHCCGTGAQSQSSYASDTTSPQLNPWLLSEIGADSVLWVRNPYFWKVDTEGNQLPYIDSVLAIRVAPGNSDIIPLRVMSGDLDLGFGSLSISDFPVYKRNEDSGGYKAYLGPDRNTSTALGFSLNLTHEDPVLREIFNDLRFRQALSLAIDRDDMNETLFLGLSEPFTAPVSPSWTGYEDWMGSHFAEFDLERANALLDEMGLEMGPNGIRLRPDGEPLTIQGDWAIEWLLYAEDAMDLVALYWAEIGVQMTPRFVPEDTLLETVYAANKQDVGVWNSDGGSETLARANFPIRLIPPWHWPDCCAMSSLPWRNWWDRETKGIERIGGYEEPPELIKHMFELSDAWLLEPRGTERYEELINELIAINAENLFYFGTVSAPPRPYMINDRIGNAPAEDFQFVFGVFTPFNSETWYVKP
jgi:peptide/nickel transport system substrate-binding protein